MNKNIIYSIIIALVILNLLTLVRLNNLKNNTENQLQQQVFTVNSLRCEINNIYTNVDEKLKKQTSILDSHNVTLGELNPSNLTLPVTLSITPKEYSEGLTATLLLNDKCVPMKKEGTSFAVSSDAYIFDDLHLKVALEQNGIKKIETIEEYYDLKGKYLLDIMGGFKGTTSYASGQYQYNGKVVLDFVLHQNSPAPEKIALIKDVNGRIIDKQEIASSNHILVDANGRIKLAAGDKFTFYAVVQDRYGLNYKYVLSAIEIDGKGESIKDINQNLMNKSVEVIDESGKVVYTIKNDFGK